MDFNSIFPLAPPIDGMSWQPSVPCNEVALCTERDATQEVVNLHFCMKLMDLKVVWRNWQTRL